MSGHKKDIQTKALKKHADHLSIGIETLIMQADKSKSSDTDDFIAYLSDASNNLDEAIKALCIGNNHIAN